MKYIKPLFSINKVLVIINLVLYLTIYLGALFQMVTGAVQLILTLIMYAHYNTLNSKSKKALNTYTVFALTSLGIMFYTATFMNLSLDYKLFIWIIIPIPIAVYHLYVTHLIKEL